MTATDQQPAAGTPVAPATVDPWAGRSSIAVGDRLRRGPLVLAGVVAAVGGAAVYLAGWPMLLRLSVPDALVFTVLAAAQLSTTAAVLMRPTRGRVLLGVAAAGAVVVWWALTAGWGVLPGPNPWMALDGVLGISDRVCLALEVVALVVLGAVGLLSGRTADRSAARSRRVWRVLAWVAVTPLLMVPAGLGVAAASNLFTGTGVPGDAVAPHDLPAGARSTVEYCRPAGTPLAMDLYTPPVGVPHQPAAAPVAVFVHGGGFVLGDRQLHGLGDDVLADPSGLLFPQLTQQLTARGFVVAAIDYRLAPAAAWPAPIQDVKCAVRFLRANATGLRIDPGRIGAWGGSAGGTLVTLLALAGPSAGFDVGQYLDQSSQVQAVIDMFGPADLVHFDDAAPWAQGLIQTALGGDPAVRASASPDTYTAHAGAGVAPMLILQGTDDPVVRPHQSLQLADRLHAAGVPTQLVLVGGAGHGFTADPAQHPSLDQLTALATGFFTTTMT